MKIITFALFAATFSILSSCTNIKVENNVGEENTSQQGAYKKNEVDSTTIQKNLYRDNIASYVKLKSTILGEVEVENNTDYTIDEVVIEYKCSVNIHGEYEDENDVLTLSYIPAHSSKKWNRGNYCLAFEARISKIKSVALNLD